MKLTVLCALAISRFSGLRFIKNAMSRLSRTLTVLFFAVMTCTLMATQAHASSWPRALVDELRELGRPVMHRYRVWDADLQVDRSIRIPVADSKLLPLQATLYRPREFRDGPPADNSRHAA